MTIIGSCKNPYLSAYYKNNTALHGRMFGDIVDLNKENRYELLIKKNEALRQIMFMYLPKGAIKYEVIYFDSTMKPTNNRLNNSQYQEITSRLLFDFKCSIYHAIKVDSSGVFFAHNYLRSSSEYEIGIFYSIGKQSINPKNVISRLNDSVFVYKEIVP